MRHPHWLGRAAERMRHAHGASHCALLAAVVHVRLPDFGLCNGQEEPPQRARWRSAVVELERRRGTETLDGNVNWCSSDTRDPRPPLTPSCALEWTSVMSHPLPYSPIPAASQA
ncbi:hypothetical protein GN956_G14819 [Arapaima gigas]